MQMEKVISLGAMVIVLISSSANAVTPPPRKKQVLQKNAISSAEQINTKTIEVYATDKAPKPYVIMSHLSVYATSVENGKRNLQVSAAKLGADAVINLNITVVKGSTFVTGVAVRWATKGENGLTRITSETPIPVFVDKEVPQSSDIESNTYDDMIHKAKMYKTTAWVAGGLSVVLGGTAAGLSFSKSGVSPSVIYGLVGGALGAVLGGTVAAVMASSWERDANAYRQTLFVPEIDWKNKSYKLSYQVVF